MVLAALQRADVTHVDIGDTRVNIETAAADILKLALVVVGLNRAPEHLFDPKFTNGQIVGALGTHHDEIVSQYSVWAVVENCGLGIKHLGIEVRDIESRTANVRAWIFRLVAISPDDVDSALDYIRLGAEDDAFEAREGLAIGLRNTYFDGLEALVLDWFYSEDESDVRDYLLDHMVAQCHRCPGYEPHVLDCYSAESENSVRR